MVYAPPIKKRQYINPLVINQKIKAHDCSKCHTEYPGKAKGIWFERFDQPNVWCWVCESCCKKRGIFV